ncbi:alpha/beta fold hydrolase [Nocardioides fonticola]
MRTTVLGITGLLALGSLLVPSAPAPAAPAAPQTSASTRASMPAAATDTAPVPLPTSDLAWGRCDEASLRSVGARCAELRVPLDHTDPGGATVTLALSRIKHTSSASRYQGALLLNPGGPGGAGRGLVGLQSYLPKKVAGTYDWIGFDPRGVGASRPRLSCQADFLGYDRPAYTPTAANVRAWHRRDRAYAEACGRKNGDLLAHDTTVDTAYDVDAIRTALGLEQITWYGYSYGTYIGQVYGTLFPERVRRIVLDSNVDPRSVWYQAGFGQARAMQPNLEKFFAWIARHHRVYRLGRTEQAVERLWVAERDRLTRRPAGTRQRIGGAEWVDAFAYVVYNSSLWPGSASVFSRWVHQRDLGALRAAYVDANGPGDDNSFAGYLAVSCSEGTYPQAWSTWRDDTRATARTAPLLAWWVTWFQEPCRYWPVRDQPLVDIDLGEVASGLLIDERWDAATPYAGSLEVRSRFPSARLVEVTGAAAVNHANSIATNPCVDRAIVRYLGTGALPTRVGGRRSDVQCRSTGYPDASVGRVVARRAPAPPGRPMR